MEKKAVSATRNLCYSSVAIGHFTVNYMHVFILLHFGLIYRADLLFQGPIGGTQIADIPIAPAPDR